MLMFTAKINFRLPGLCKIVKLFCVRFPVSFCGAGVHPGRFNEGRAVFLSFVKSADNFSAEKIEHNLHCPYARAPKYAAPLENGSCELISNRYRSGRKIFCKWRRIGSMGTTPHISAIQFYYAGSRVFACSAMSALLQRPVLLLPSSGGIPDWHHPHDFL